MVEIVQVIHVCICLHLERIEIVAGVSHLARIAQSRKHIPQVANIETKPRIVCALSLPQVYHLVVLGVGQPVVQQVGIILIVSKNKAEHRYRSIVLPAEKPVHRGRHIGNGVRPRSSEYELEDIQESYFFFVVLVFFRLFALVETID